MPPYFCKVTMITDYGRAIGYLARVNNLPHWLITKGDRSGHPVCVRWKPTDKWIPFYRTTV